VVEEAALPWARFLASLEGREVTFVAQNAAIFAPGGLAELADVRLSRPVVVVRLLAPAVARLAASRLAAPQEFSPAEAADANYVRRSDAELRWRDPG
jgi:hypothetical protein